MFSRRQAVMFLATGCYVGRAPLAPGTLGTLVGIPIVWALSKLHWPMAAGTTVLIILGAVWVAHQAELLLNTKDPGCIVIDEIAGLCVAMFGVPFTWGTALAGFVLFRIFDVIKPPPIKQVERYLSGGWGIVMDDVVAGGIVCIVMHIGLTLMKQ